MEKKGGGKGVEGATSQESGGYLATKVGRDSLSLGRRERELLRPKKFYNFSYCITLAIQNCVSTKQEVFFGAFLAI